MRPEILYPFFQNIKTIKGVGEYIGKNLPKITNGDKVVDVLFTRPNSVLERKKLASITSAEIGDIVIIEVEVVNVNLSKNPKKYPTRITLLDKTGYFFDVTYFHFDRKYIESLYKVKDHIIISGKVDKYGDKKQISHPDYVLPLSEKTKIKQVEPQYALTSGISNKMMLNIVANAFNITKRNLNQLPEWQNEDFLRKNKFIKFSASLYKIHNPDKIDDIDSGSIYYNRLVYDECLSSQLALAIIRHREKKVGGLSHFSDKHDFREQLLQSLSYKLTDAQKQAISEIDADMKSSNKMIRLLQGDVGSGKTVVALIAMLNAVSDGFQAAIMAPTEILAEQHYQSITEMLKKAKIDIFVVTLLGKDSSSTRMQKSAKIKSGSASIIIGTHTLFQEKVNFSNLGLVIVDEQHRFGVEQRVKLVNKGENADVLVMSATPIPRSLTLTLYGDMDLSVIDEMPPGRKPVETAVMPLKKLDEVVEKIKEKISQGDKVYWVCPLVEESEKLDLAAAEERFSVLKNVFNEKVSIVHGKMKNDLKEKAMSDFSDPTSPVKILVATTVIEVGVNIPDATIMIVEHAERFGLSQLHQLRGRVGRGNKQGTCILMYGKGLSETGKQRLKIMRETNDGFRIAEEDLKIRGGGEILGKKQSGVPEFRFADFNLHKNLFYTAHKDAQMIMNNDPYLQSDRGQALKLLLHLFKKNDWVEHLKSG